MKTILLFFFGILAIASASKTPIPTAWIDEVEEWMLEGLRIDSSSIPLPGNERAFVEYIAGILEEENIDFNIYDIPLPGTPLLLPTLVATIDGSETGYLMMSSHSDTIEISTMQDALLGEVVDGYIVGRGALDMKHQVIWNLAAMVWTKRLELPIIKGLMMAVFPGEELGLLGAMLSASDPAFHTIFSNVEMSIDEVGGVTTNVLGKTFMPITFGEKGACWMKIDVNSFTVHGSSFILPSTLPLYKLAAAIGYIYADNGINEPVYTELSTTMLNEIEAAVSRSNRATIRNLKTGCKYHRVAESLTTSDALGSRFLIPQLQRLYHGTSIDGSYSITNTPYSVSAIFSALVFPGESCQVAIDEVMSKIADDSITITRYIPTGMSPDLAEIILAGSEEDINDPNLSKMFAAISTIVGSDMPGVAPIHSITPALTDCTVMKNMFGIPCIGFSPMHLEPGTFFEDFIHSAEDRCPLYAFRNGTLILFHSVERYITTP
jgi:acetylornithine deacetylase/succinyl-diaminopimelate desuccinylase-like protein